MMSLFPIVLSPQKRWANGAYPTTKHEKYFRKPLEHFEDLAITSRPTDWTTVLDRETPSQRSKYYRRRCWGDEQALRKSLPTKGQSGGYLHPLCWSYATRPNGYVTTRFYWMKMFSSNENIIYTTWNKFCPWKTPQLRFGAQNYEIPRVNSSRTKGKSGSNSSFPLPGGGDVERSNWSAHKGCAWCRAISSLNANLLLVACSCPSLRWLAFFKFLSEKSLPNGYKLLITTVFSDH